MPYTIKKNGEQWCVYKESADKQPTGDTLGCHDTEDEAKKQLAALYANVPDARSKKVTGTSRLDNGIERCDVLGQDIELRVDDATGAPRVEGYAAVFNSPSEVLFEWDKGRFREMVMPGAFAKTIKERDIHLLVEHADLPLATTRAGTLDLKEDDHGLRFSSVLDPEDPDVKRLLPKLRRGDMSKCSFGFVPIREDPLDGKTRPPTRRLREVQLFDVSIVSRPAYPATEAKVRKILAEDGLDAAGIAELLVRMRMGLPLEDEDLTLMRRLAETIRRFLPDDEPPANDSTTAPDAAPLPTEHPDEGPQPATAPTAQLSQEHPEGQTRSTAELWRRLAELEKLL